MKQPPKYCLQILFVIYISYMYFIRLTKLTLSDYNQCSFTIYYYSTVHADEILNIVISILTLHWNLNLIIFSLFAGIPCHPVGDPVDELYERQKAEAKAEPH